MPIVLDLNYSPSW